jgi:hypothetical protein
MEFLRPNYRLHYGGIYKVAYEYYTKASTHERDLKIIYLLTSNRDKEDRR